MIEDMARGNIPNTASMPSEAIDPKLGDLVLRAYSAADVADAADRMLTEAAEAHIKGAYFPMGGDETLAAPGGIVLGTLCTVPGIGKVTAMTWMARVGDPRRFGSSKAVAAFAGCDPTLKISAGKVTSYVRRGGDIVLHEVLVHAAMGLVNRASEPLGRWGARLAAKPGKGQWRKAVGAVAGRLAVGLYHVHRAGQPFSYEKYCLDLRLTVPDLPVDGIGLSGRAVAVLKRHGIHTAEELAKRFGTDLGKVKGIGVKTYAEVSEWVDKVRETRS